MNLVRVIYYSKAFPNVLTTAPPVPGSQHETREDWYKVLTTAILIPGDLRLRHSIPGNDVYSCPRSNPGSVHGGMDEASGVGRTATSNV